MNGPGLFPEAGPVVDHDGRAVLFPGFIDWEAADALLTRLMEEVAWEQADLVMFGKKVTEPRMSVWYSPDGIDYVYSGTRRTAHPFTPAVAEIHRLVEEHTGARFNSALVNLYRDGNDRLGWHSDNEEINGPEPTIASVSLGAERFFDLRHSDTGETRRVLLPHGSLLLMSGPLQQRWVHQVPAMKKVRAPRVNLTFRLVRLRSD